MSTFRKKVTPNKLYKEYVDLLNGKLQLSERETAVFSLLLKLNQEWGTAAKELGSILTTDSRRILMKETLISKTNIARYINSLVNKGVLIRKEGSKVQINEMFVPDIVVDHETKKRICEVKFVLEEV